MLITKISEIKKILNAGIAKYNSICILTHKNPDGDGLCAALALQEMISQFGKNADLVLEDYCPEIYDFLDGEERTKVYSDHMIYDLLIILDCHEEERLGICTPLIPTAKQIVVIDHHVQQNILEDASTYIDTETVSAGAIVFKMYEKELEEFPAEEATYIATAIYTTILNDTDNFLNRNTDEDTFYISSKLMQYGIIPGYITEHFLLSNTADQIKFVGEVLATIETFDDEKVLFMHATQDMLYRNGLDNTATSKLTRWVKGTRHVEALACIVEVRKNRYRLSLRSNNINVNKVAVKFGGGGHKKASGCELKGSLVEIKNIILEEFRKQL
jgi:bifunctional oligoribonuclease and PAP phosphatase NrnA